MSKYKYEVIFSKKETNHIYTNHKLKTKKIHDIENNKSHEKKCPKSLHEADSKHKNYMELSLSGASRLSCSDFAGTNCMRLGFASN